MPMLLQYHNRRGIVAEFSPDDGNLEVLQRPAGVVRTDGWFSVLGGALVAFYRARGSLWLRVGAHVLEIGEDPAIPEWRRETHRSVLRVVVDGETVELRYRTGPFEQPTLANDPTPFVESEDWDFGLFITNVLSSDERRAVISRAPDAR